MTPNAVAPAKTKEARNVAATVKFDMVAHEESPILKDLPWACVRFSSNEIHICPVFGKAMKKILAIAILIAASASAGPGHDESPEGHTGVVGPDMYNNETWAYTFTEAGNFEYHCHPHPWMQASIIVDPSNGSAPMNHEILIIEPENYDEWDFDPVTLTIQAGDTVTWINEGMQMHKVAETTAEHADHIAGAGSTVDEHGDHEHNEGGISPAILWIGGALIVGLLAAQWFKNKSE